MGLFCFNQSSCGHAVKISIVSHDEFGYTQFGDMTFNFSLQCGINTLWSIMVDNQETALIIHLKITNSFELY